MNPHHVLLITAAGYIIGSKLATDEKKQSILLGDVHINNTAQRLIDHFESLEIAKEHIIGYKSLSNDDSRNLIARWQSDYFTTS
ncbi:hypothetical protein HCB69_13520 [Listeria booriae]|uniref:Uncharacterized protein n=1 Tax=Listeria booriae TaxID=1552123 RepID=A0A842FKU3_9LIST|nr:hypothetical protein [Listeria booriae]MBC2285402.1 hypothetical protein [Listeria booriae]MBC2293251.1 hypothetical protein [Listeria booriae]